MYVINQIPLHSFSESRIDRPPVKRQCVNWLFIDQHCTKHSYLQGLHGHRSFINKIEQFESLAFPTFAEQISVKDTISRLYPSFLCSTQTDDLLHFPMYSFPDPDMWRRRTLFRDSGPDWPWRHHSMLSVWMASVTVLCTSSCVCFSLLSVTVFVPVFHGSSHHEVISEDAPGGLLLCSSTLHAHTQNQQHIEAIWNAHNVYWML